LIPSDFSLPILPPTETKGSVLILHEDQGILETLLKAVSFLGFDRISAMQNFEEAVWESSKKEIVFFLCAYTTPTIQGLRFLSLIRKNERFAYTPFFLMDPEFTSLKVMKAGYAGVTGLLVWPFTPRILQEKLAKSLGQTRDPHIRKTETQLEKGVSLIDTGRFKEGVAQLKSILDQKEGPEYHYNIGYIRSIQKRYPEAIEAFRKATQLDRLFAKAYEAMGRAYRAMGRDDLADQYLGHAAQIHMERDNDGHAEDILKEMLALGYESLNVFNSLGIIYRKRGDHQNAMIHYAKALKVHPDEPHIHYNMGRICLDMKDMDKAREFFEKAVKIQKDFKEARQILKAMDLGIL
jgi:tetratricopeptide (TPR) repeat protein